MTHNPDCEPPPLPRKPARGCGDRIRRNRTGLLAFAVAILLGLSALADDSSKFSDEIAPLFKERCVKCHGPAKAEGKLNLSTASAVARGGKNGPIVAPHQLDESVLWDRISTDEMPPKHPLSDDEKSRIKQWILSGAPGLPSLSTQKEGDHWAFQSLRSPPLPAIKNEKFTRGPIDRFLEAALEKSGRTLSKEAPRERLIRRVSLTLTGLPPTPSEVASFLNDDRSDAYERMVERYLASPHYGEKWGKYWLDAVGYADSNGYFNADSDRPLAYRYRDYVIRSMNEDRPFDRFLREQLAGDEMPGFQPGEPVTPEVAERLIATHFLRNGQDGSGESDGNPDEVRVDRYTALESCQQIVASSLMGLTVQCAKCHAHKFEPISQEDYYRFQAIFAPVFPAATDSLWIKPQARFVLAPTADEKQKWETQHKEAEEHATKLRAELAVWVKANRPQGEILFLDDFESDSTLAPRWSNVAPTDDSPGGKIPVSVDGEKPPAARSREKRLEILAGETLDSWLTTTKSFDWTPDREGESIQATFDLVDNKLSDSGKPAERVGYFIATHDFDDSGKLPGGNLLVDGHPSGSTSVFLDYPGSDSRTIGMIGRSGYGPGRNYGVRITNVGKGQFQLAHLVDGFAEEGVLTLRVDDLPDGGFGFEYHADRSFVVDNVRIERFPAPAAGSRNAIGQSDQQVRPMRKKLEAVEKKLANLKANSPGRIAWATDVSATPPETHLLVRGDYAKPGDVMVAAPLSALATPGATFAGKPPSGARTTGRRLAFANWLTDPNERASSLLARVQVNRVWQAHFGVGIVATPENFGLSGSPPTHPELLDWLASDFIGSGWSFKHLHREILNSTAFRQASDAPDSQESEDRRLGRFPAHRLDAETIRDAMLAVGGELDKTMGGPYVPIQARGDGAIVIPESQAGARRRSVYLQQRRTQVVSLLQVFDAPTIVFNSLRRPRTAMPLQSLALMNSEFVRTRAMAFAKRLEQQEFDAAGRIQLAFLSAYSRPPTLEEEIMTFAFLNSQEREHGGGPDARKKAWVDLCQSLLMSNEFLYID